MLKWLLIRMMRLTGALLFLAVVLLYGLLWDHEEITNSVYRDTTIDSAIFIAGWRSV